MRTSVCRRGRQQSLDNDFFPTYPASYTAENMVTVAATNNFDQRAYFSNYGHQSVHLGAPGDNILSTIIGNAYLAASGTSMATPRVSGAAALLLSVCDLDTPGLKDALIGTVDCRGADRQDDHRGPSQRPQRRLSCLAPPPTPQNLAARVATIA